MKIAAYRKKLEELDQLKNELEKMEKSERIKKELSFIKDVNKVLQKHSRTAADLAIAFPESTKPSTQKKTRTRKSSPMRTFKHPKTGAKIKAKRTNNKELKAWATELDVSVESLEVK